MEGGETVLEAAEDGDLALVRSLISQDGGLVHATDDIQYTPLLWAVEIGGVDMAQFLLDHRADINHRDITGATAIYHACENGHLEMTVLLLRKGAHPRVDQQDGSTPLMIAAANGSADVVNVLLSCEGGERAVDRANDAGRTAMHMAGYWGEDEVLEQLLEAGAGPAVRGNNGRTPRDEALLETGLDPAVRRGDGSPVMEAGDRGYDNCISMLEEWDRAYALVKARRLRDATRTNAAT